MKKRIVLLLALLMLAVFCASAWAEPDAVMDASADEVAEFDPEEAEVPYEYTVEQEQLAAQDAGENAPVARPNRSWIFVALAALLVVVAVAAILIARKAEKERRRREALRRKKARAARPQRTPQAAPRNRAPRKYN